MEKQASESQFSTTVYNNLLDNKTENKSFMVAFVFRLACVISKHQNRLS